MKAVKKSTVLALARVTRKYVKSGDVDFLEAGNNYAKKIAEQLSGCDRNWWGIKDLFSALCGIFPVKQCTNAEIIGVLNYLGIEVEEGEECNED